MQEYLTVTKNSVTEDYSQDGKHFLLRFWWQKGIPIFIKSKIFLYNINRRVTNYFSSFHFTTVSM